MVIKDRKLWRRFWSKVKIGPGCWEWQAGSRGEGYGGFRLNNKNKLAHRTAWKLIFGKVPESLWVLHKCDNRKCVRPSHLFLGTDKENAIDRDAKGRGNKTFGKDHWRTKLTEDDIVRVRKLGENSCVREVATVCNISYSTAWSIINGRTWRHVK